MKMMEQFKEMAMLNDITQSQDSNMKVLSREKTKVLAEKFGWSLSKAEGYVDGEIFRRRAKAPPTHAQVGIDDYSLGFRAGYYEREDADRAGTLTRTVASAMPAMRRALHQPKDLAEPALQARVFSEQGG